MLVGFPNGALPEDHTMNVHAASVLAALLLASAACAGTDTNKPGSDVTDLTAVVGAPPVVTPPVTGTPSTSSNFAGPGLSGLALVSDDFTKYSNTADLLSNITSIAGGTGAWNNSFYGDGLNAGLAELDKTVLYNGHATMKYNQSGGVYLTPQLHAYFPSRPHIWYRAKVRFSPGFTTAGVTANAANAYKLLSWGWNGPDGSGRVEITNTSQYELYESVQTGPSRTGGGAIMTAGNINTEWTDGGWYDYIIEVDHSQPIGMIRLWRAKDGQSPIYQGQMQEKMDDGSSMPPLTNISVGLNFNQVRAPNQNQAVWWGEWEVVDGAQHPNPFGVSQ